MSEVCEFIKDCTYYPAHPQRCTPWYSVQCMEAIRRRNAVDQDALQLKDEMNKNWVKLWKKAVKE